jgi:hypothetical protein
MLIDEIQPIFDFTEVHRLRIRASAEITCRAIQETTLADISGIVRWLFFLRELPEKMVGRKVNSLQAIKPLLEEMYKNGFTRLAEKPGQELVFGTIVPDQIGRVWNKASSLGVEVMEAEKFILFDNPDYLRVVANLRVDQSQEPGYVVVYTESRTRALSPRARKNFAPYWAVIRPFSGLIRRLWLRGIQRRAEAAQAGLRVGLESNQLT